LVAQVGPLRFVGPQRVALQFSLVKRRVGALTSVHPGLRKYSAVIHRLHRSCLPHRTAVSNRKHFSTRRANEVAIFVKA